MDEQTAGIMVTNPNTLGIFEENIKKIEEIVHAKGGLVCTETVICRSKTYRGDHEGTSGNWTTSS